MVIDKPRHHRGRSFRSRGRRLSRRNDRHLRSEAEQLDYEMELLRAQREGREEEFKSQEREKQRARAAARLDAEMDDYFSGRPKKASTPNENNNSAEPDAANKPHDENIPDATAGVSEAPAKTPVETEASETQPPTSEPEKSMSKPLDGPDDPQSQLESAQ